MPNSKVYVIAPVPNLGALVRTTKLLSVLQGVGLNVHHLSWQRSAGEQPNNAPVETTCVYQGGGYKNRLLVLRYPVYMAALKKHLDRLPDGSSIYGLSLWSAAPVAKLAHKKGLNLLFDNNDNLSMAYPWPGPIKKIVAGMEFQTARSASIHVVPSKARWPHPDANLRIIPNVPLSSDVETAKRLAEESRYTRNRDFTLYVNGWLTPTRGLRQLSEALDSYQGEPFRVLVAGRIDEVPEAKWFLQHPFVEFLGQVSPAESLARYWDAHACFTFYDPAIPINRLAESNKWGDCVLTRCAILVNDEVQTARAFVDKGGAHSVPYNDAKALACLLAELADDPQKAVRAGQNLDAFSYEPWDKMVGDVVSEWLSTSAR